MDSYKKYRYGCVKYLREISDPWGHNITHDIRCMSCPRQSLCGTAICSFCFVHSYWKDFNTAIAVTPSYELLTIAINETTIALCEFLKQTHKMHRDYSCDNDCVLCGTMNNLYVVDGSSVIYVCGSCYDICK